METDDVMAASIDALEDLEAITEHARAAVVEQARAVCARSDQTMEKIPERLADLIDELGDRITSLERAEAFEQSCRDELGEMHVSIVLLQAEAAR